LPDEPIEGKTSVMEEAPTIYRHIYPLAADAVLRLHAARGRGCVYLLQNERIQTISKFDDFTLQFAFKT